MTPVCVHQTPGRLRLRSSAVKNSELRARMAQSHLGRCEGVRTVEANPLTGSVLICFDPAGASVDVLLRELVRSERARPDHRFAQAAQNNGEPMGPTMGKSLVKATFQYGAGQLAERLLLIMIAAVLA